MGIYKILSHIYLDKIHKCYKKIFIFNNKPEDITNIKTVPQEKKSPYDDIYCCDRPPHCIHGVLYPNTNQFMRIKDLDILLSFLIKKGYKIEKELTETMIKNKEIDENLLCVVSKINI